MRRIAIAVLLACGSCLHGTTTPGLTQCLWYFIPPFWVMHECQQGPPWLPSSAAPPVSVQTMPAVKPDAAPDWCTTRSDGVAVCLRTEELCNGFRGSGDYGPCERRAQ